MTVDMTVSAGIAFSDPRPETLLRCASVNAPQGTERVSIKRGYRSEVESLLWHILGSELMVEASGGK